MRVLNEVEKEVKRGWQTQKDKAMKGLETARTKALLKKLNREVQVCNMMLRGL